MSDFIEFRHLEYLIAVDEGKTFTKAGEKVSRSQPTISQQIKAVEDDAGFPIFVRSGREGVTRTPSGSLVLSWSKKVLRERREIFIMARAIYQGKVPPLRLGFSPFVTPFLLHAFRITYEELFPECEIHLSSGNTTHTLERLEHGDLDCAILPMPIDRDLWNVLEVFQAPLFLCMREDDPLASQTRVDIQEAAPRIKIFRDPQLQPAAHARLIEMFIEAGISMHLASSAASSTDMQWMVKENYGLALIDGLCSLESGLVTRPIAGVSWTADTAFVMGKESRHIALPYVEQSLRENGLQVKRKPPQSEHLLPQQLKLIG